VAKLSRFRSFVGRNAELTALGHARRRAAAGNGSIVLVAGEAGVGKSRLLQEFSDGGASGKSIVLATSCSRHVRRPYGPFVSVLEEMADVAVPDSVPAFAEVLKTISARRSAILLVENVQHADVESLELLTHLASVVGRLPLLVVATYRPEEVQPDSAAFAHLAALHRDPAVERLELKPLRAEDIRALVRSAVGAELSESRILSDIERRSQGNPFFAVELLRDALDATGQPGANGTLPLSIRGAALERLSSLEEEDRRVLSYASVIGRRFDLALVCVLLNCEAQSLHPRLKRARDRLIISETGTQNPAFEFRNVLTQEVLYGEWLDAEARPLHASIARLLEAAPEDQRSIPDLAYHFWRAHDVSKAAVYNEAAGAAADAAGDGEAAIEFYERALRDVKEHADAARIHAKLGNVLFRIGYPERAREAYERAIERYRSAGRPAQAAPLALSLCRSYYNSGDPKRSSDAARMGLQLLADRPDDPVALQLRLHIVNVAIDGGDVEQANAEFEAIDTKALAKDADLGAGFHRAKVLACALTGDLAAWKEHVAAFDAVVPRVRDRGPIMGFLGGIATSASCLGEGDIAADHFDRCIAMGREWKTPTFVAAFAVNYAFEHYLRGRFTEARKLLDDVRGVRHEIPNTRIYLAVAGICLGLAVGDDDFIDSCVEPGIMDAAFASRQSSFFGALAGPYALMLFDRGDAEQARSVLRRALESLDDPLGTFMTPLAAAEIGEKAELEMGRRLVAAAAHRAPLAVHTATVAMFDAIAEKRSGNEEASRARAATAAQLYRAIGWPVYHAAAIELAGRADEALSTYRRIGCLRAIRRLERSTLRGRRSPNEPAAILSAREREIADLVARGRSNAAVATALSISEKTVEKHLSSVFSKLGLTSRSQLAAYLGSPRAK
jgi:DNA-binding NarL/FixJ family response regulator